jgi:hypothetical protein
MLHSRLRGDGKGLLIIEKILDPILKNISVNGEILEVVDILVFLEVDAVEAGHSQGEDIRFEDVVFWELG